MEDSEALALFKMIAGDRLDIVGATRSFQYSPTNGGDRTVSDDWRKMYRKAKEISENADIMEGAPYKPIKDLADIVARLCDEQEIEKQYQDREEAFRGRYPDATPEQIRAHMRAEREREKSRGD